MAASSFGLWPKEKSPSLPKSYFFPSNLNPLDDPFTPSEAKFLSFKEILASPNPLNLGNFLIILWGAIDPIDLIISDEDLERIKKSWRTSLIVKAFEKNFGFRFFDKQIKELWKPKSKFSITDLGKDYFITRFDDQDGFLRILSRGPWFLSGHFLTIRLWKPNFNSNLASFSSVVVLIRLPVLLVEYFGTQMLMKLVLNKGNYLK
ncbi:hypothetical protein ACH5RR_001242 [Cinchona calisaya]|uniref:DUF4283 domain-containing protein n=1 Tax=Cinchona calisaya TaxID=153742 RepID=A0ABD3B3F0_9GENT